MAALKSALDSVDKRYVSTSFYTASYNSPWDFFNRHNEVWLIKK